MKIIQHRDGGSNRIMQRIPVGKGINQDGIPILKSIRKKGIRYRVLYS